MRVITTDHLTVEQRRSVCALLDAAFEGSFTPTDWDHAVGGQHVLVTVGESIVAHAAVVPRRLRIAERPVGVGYVEAVATAPDEQRLGYGTAAMTEIGAIIRVAHELGVLSTGSREFYERVGWEPWRGPSSVRRADGVLVRTHDDDDGLMFLRTDRSEALDPMGAIVCDERDGDDW